MLKLNSNKICRRRSTVPAISVHLLFIISFVLFVMPTPSLSAVPFPNRKLSPNYIIHLSNSSPSNRSYAVIFDAGSTGSRVHVFCFDHNLDLVPIGDDFELSEKIKPGLSAYAKDPKAAADSLRPLLRKAEDAVPASLRPATPLKLGATAGLRLLPGDASDKILQSVRDLFKEKSTLKSKDEWVKVLDGIEEGSYQWVTINYLLGKLGKHYSKTVGVVDMGGGSVQMAYAISNKAAAQAPSDTKYFTEMYLRGAKYNVYAHSYLKYGLLAARAEILKIKSKSNPCILEGYKGTYTYGGASYPVSSSPSGPTTKRCRNLVLKALRVNDTCPYKNKECSFGGVWNGGGGPGHDHLYVGSFFYGRASEVGIINANEPIAKVRPVEYAKAAKRACAVKFKDAKSEYPTLTEDALPYICMDLVYQYSLLVHGFGLDPLKEITLATKIQYRNHLVDAAWPLGSAIDVMSSLTSPKILLS